MKKISTLVTAMLIMHLFTAAQFVREYNPGGTAKLVFTCIAKAQNGNYFISGLQDTSIYVSEVLANGNVVREKLIGIGTNYYRITSMIVDADGNIVLVGLQRLPSGVLQGYLMKISPALSVILHVSYINSATADGMALADVKDFKTTGGNNGYYVTGYTYSTTTGWNPMLLRLDRSTGTVLATYNGHPTGVAANTAQGSYSSLLLDTLATAGSPSSIYVTAPLNSGGIPTNRPWLTKHAISTLGFTSAERYLRDIGTAQQASLYNIGIAKDAASILYCWYGSPNVASNSTHTAMGLTKVNAGNLAPVWQKRYTVTPAAASPFKYNAMVKVENDANGYITRGIWLDGVNESGGDIFFIRTNKNGVPQWARQYKNVSNVQSFNSCFLVDGGNIFAVGFRTNSGNAKGILIVTPLATGSMDTTCAKPLTVATADSIYAKADNLTALTIPGKIANNYYPVNCVTTTSVTPCKDCISSPTGLNANFTINGQLVGSSNTYSLTASAYTTTNNSIFIVSQVTPTVPYPDIANTVYSNTGWGGTATTTFNYYNGTTGPGSNVPGIFTIFNIYRVRHILSTFNNCGILVSDTVSKLVLFAPGLKAPTPGHGNGSFMVIDEPKGGVTNPGQLPGQTSAITVNSITAGKSNSGASIFPNPANAFVVFNTADIRDENSSLKIVNSNGVTISTSALRGRKQASVDTHIWASGLYLYNIISNGKVVAQGKFIVQH